MAESERIDDKDGTHEIKIEKEPPGLYSICM